MKRLTLSLVIAIVAVVVSAFSQTKGDLRKSRYWVAYSNTGNGVYVLTTGWCIASDVNSCIYIFDNPENNAPIETFDINEPSSMPTNLGRGFTEGLAMRM